MIYCDVIINLLYQHVHRVPCNTGLSHTVQVEFSVHWILDVETPGFDVFASSFFFPDDQSETLKMY